MTDSYGDVDVVRILCGVSSDILSSGDISQFLEYADAQINKDIGVFTGTVPTEIEQLSELLACIQIYNRPDLRFRLTQAQIQEQQLIDALNRWKAEVDRIYGYYDSRVSETPVCFRVGESE